MKKVLLIGDSIRMGYDNYVKESMKDFADVFFTKENNTFTHNILRNFHGWTDALGLYEADVIHWNVGHWDTVRIYGDEPLTKHDVYADNLVRISRRIKLLFPDAKQIFATSTPVIEEGFIEEFECRKNSDVILYNKLAKEALTPEGVIINDLHAVVYGKPDSLHSDQTHYYTAEATRLLGDKVNEVICGALGVDTSLLTPPKLDDYKLIVAKSDREMFEKCGNIWKLKR